MRVTKIPNTVVVFRRGDGTHVTTAECAGLIVRGAGPPMDVHISHFDLLENHDGSYEVECTYQEATAGAVEWHRLWSAFDRGEGVTG